MRQAETVVAVPEWNLFIGAGAYIYDIEEGLRAEMRDLAWKLGPAALVLLLVAFLLARAVSGPLSALTAAMTRLARGDLDAPVVGAGRRDEIGAMARTVEVFKDALVAKRATDAVALAEANAKARRVSTLR